VLLLIGKVTTPRLKTNKINGTVPLLKNNVTFNDLLNVPNHYIFKCPSVINVKNGGRIPGFLGEFGPFLVVY